ncbi:phenylacetate--CoA ligase [Amycolatopsis sp. K13G38]|uniref:Phenylacetate--CoA ligase n=1 Tax=Amycolatopsis acididurans TaxID=2724524 RepID=A0ABX1JGF9_9PSEU|nr:phenylacetate--CoA ligase [Amycolatopsis acididurans]NKQ58474.1 phenylacetate--CoA ligase [Amycolatopsis acididurans]
MTAHFVAAEDIGEVHASLRRRLDLLVERSPFYADLFAEHGIAPAALESLDALSKFPFTTKHMLRESQAAAPPLGRHAGVAMDRIIRVHASTGTTGKPSWVGVTRADSSAWTEMTANAMHTQGLVASDVVVHGAGLTLFVGGLPVRDAIERIGATMVPIGTGASEKAVLAMSTLAATTLHSTPSYARYLAEYIREKLGRDPRELGLGKIMVGGEPGGGEPAFRAHLEREWGATVTEGLGNADMAPILFAERPGTAGMRYTGGKHVVAELVDPSSGDPVEPEPGATGELVYTSVDRECCALVRFRTRDRVRVTGMDGATPLIRCVGRADDMLIVLGVNVFPSAVRDLVHEFHPRTSGAIQIVLPSDGPRVEPPLNVEAEWGEAPGDRDELARWIERAIRRRLTIPATVTLVPPGSIARSEMKTSLTRRR